MSGFAGHIESWLATTRQEKITSLKGLSGYNPPRITRETCSVIVMMVISGAKCKSSLLWRHFYNVILASDSEPDIFVSGEAGHEQGMLARYRLPRKDRQIVGYEWIQTIIALEKIGYFYTLPSRPGAKIGYFTFAPLFSIFGIVSIHN